VVADALSRRDGQKWFQSVYWLQFTDKLSQNVELRWAFQSNGS
jgi:hypothetical protein